MDKAKVLNTVIKYASENQIPIKQLEEQINKLKDLATKLPAAFKIDRTVDVIMKYWKSPADFYVAKMDYEDELESLQSVVQKSVLLENVFIPNKGIVCAANINGIWYRVRLESVKSNQTCRVRLLDFGNSEIVPFESLFLLEACLFHISPLMVKCRLLNEQIWSKKCRFDKICEIATAFQIIVNDIKDNEYFVELFATVHGQSENVELFLLANEIMETTAITADVVMEDDCTMSIDNSKDISFDILNSSSIPESVVASSPNKFSESKEALNDDVDNSNGEETNGNGQRFSSSRAPAKLVYFVSPNEFYICLHKNEDALQVLHRNVQQICFEITNKDIIEEHPWKLNDLCFVQAQVKELNKNPLFLKWYRGRIMKMGEKEFDIFLIDVGAMVKVHPYCVYHSDDDTLNKVKSGVIECQMACIKPRRGNDWDARYMKRVEMGIQQYNVLAVSIQMKELKSLSQLPVILWGGLSEENALVPTKRTWININEELVKIEIAALVENFIDIDPNESDDIDMSFLDVSFDDAALNANEEASGGDEISFYDEPTLYNITSEISKVEQWLPSEPISKTIFTGIATYVDSKCRIYLLTNYRKYVADKMALIIQQRIEEMPENMAETKWTRGAPCLARYADGKYYRAEVRRLGKENQLCTVRFVDYGNVETVKQSDVRIADILGDIPILARRYSLGKVKPITPPDNREKWLKSVINFVQLEVLDVTCSIRVRDCEKCLEDDAEVDITGAGITDIRTYLLTAKLAIIEYSKIN